MKKKEINEKYNVKMILEEMYVYNDEKLTDAVLRLVILKDKRENSLSKYLHLEVIEDRGTGGDAMDVCWVDYAISVEDYKAMHTKTQKPEIKVGEYGYFWNDNLEIKYFFYGKLKFIFEPNTTDYRFKNEFDHCLQHFSKTHPEWANNL